MKSITHNQRAFTLIEVLVSMAVIAILVTLASTIFISTVRSSKKAETTNEARQNATLVIDSLQRDVRDGISLVLTDISGTDQPGTTNVGLHVYGKNPKLWICNAPGASTNGFITSGVLGSLSTVTNRDTVDGVSLTNCVFTLIGNSKAATLSFDVHEGVGVTGVSNDYQINLHFETTVSPRNFN